MAIALVKLGTVATGTTSAAPTFGQATGSGNLLVAWVYAEGVTPSALSVSAAGWTVVDGAVNRGAIFYKPNSAASETAPTFSNAGASSIVVALGEYSGADTVAPLDQHHDAGGGTTSPQVAANVSVDSAPSDLVASVSYAAYTMAATKTTTDTYNNGATATDVGNNDATSTAAHYRLSYGITTGNASATQVSFAFTTTNISGAAPTIATFKVATAAGPEITEAVQDILGGGDWLPSVDPDGDHWGTDYHLTSLDSMPPIIAGPPVAPALDIETQAIAEESYQHDSGQSEEFWANVYGFPDPALEVAPAFFPPAVTDDGYIASLDLVDADFEAEPEPFDAGLPEQLEAFIAGPPDAFDLTIATQPLAEQPWYPDEEAAPELANDPSLDTTPVAFPPDAFDTTAAAQPLAEQPWFPDPDIDTELANDPSLEVHAALFPPDVTQEFFGDQLDEQPWFPDLEADTELANDASLDVTAAFFPPPATDDSYVAHTDAPQQPWFPDPEADTELANDALEVTAAFFPPDVDETFFAQQPLAEQPWYPDVEVDTELANDSTLDPVAVFFPPDVEREFFSDQLDEQPWFPEQDVDIELSNDSTVEVVGALFPPDVEREFFSDQLDEQPWFAEQEIDTELANDSALDVTAQFFPPAAATDDSYVATIDAPQQPPHEEEEPTYQPHLEELEGFLFPPDAFDTTAAAQPDPSHGQDAGTFPPDDPTDDQPLVDGAVEALQAGPPLFAPDEVLAAQPDPSLGQDPGLNPEWDPTNDQPLVDGALEAFQSPNDAFDVTAAATGLLPPDPDADDVSVPDGFTDDPAPYLATATDDGYVALTGAEPGMADEEAAWVPDPTEDGAVAAVLAGDDSYIAALGLAEQAWFDAEDFDADTSAITADPIAALLASAASTAIEVAATRDARDQTFYPDPEEQPEQSATPLDVSAYFFQVIVVGTNAHFAAALVASGWTMALAEQRWDTGPPEAQWIVIGVSLKWKVGKVEVQWP